MGKVKSLLWGLLIFFPLMELRVKLLGELEVTVCILTGVQLTEHPKVSHSRLDQLQPRFSEGTPQLGSAVLEPDLGDKEVKK